MRSTIQEMVAGPGIQDLDRVAFTSQAASSTDGDGFIGGSSARRRLALCSCRATTADQLIRMKASSAVTLAPVQVVRVLAHVEHEHSIDRRRGRSSAIGSYRPGTSCDPADSREDCPTPGEARLS
jgi:hypothetical protein